MQKYRKLSRIQTLKFTFLEKSATTIKNDPFYNEYSFFI